MTPKEAWEALDEYLYQCNVDEYAANCGDEASEQYDEAVATLAALVKANPDG